MLHPHCCFLSFLLHVFIHAYFASKRAETFPFLVHTSNALPVSCLSCLLPLVSSLLFLFLIPLGLLPLLVSFLSSLVSPLLFLFLIPLCLILLLVSCLSCLSSSLSFPYPSLSYSSPWLLPLFLFRVYFTLIGEKDISYLNASRWSMGGGSAIQTCVHPHTSPVLYRWSYPRRYSI
jgi:hypothetical protein